MAGTYNVESPGVVRGFLLPLRTLDDSSSKIEPIFFQSMPSVSDSKSANYNGESAPGRGDAYSIYSGSGSRSIGLELSYVAVNDRFDYQWVMQQLSRLKALVYPIYTRMQAQDTAFTPPPLVLLNLGYHFVNVPCVVTSYNISNAKEDPYEIYTMLPMINNISLSLQTSYPYGQVPGHDDIAASFIGDPSFETAGFGDAVLPDQASPAYDKLIESVPISPKSDAAAIAEYQRTVEIRSSRSKAVSRPLSQTVFFSDEVSSGRNSAGTPDDNDPLDDSNYASSNDDFDNESGSSGTSTSPGVTRDEV